SSRPVPSAYPATSAARSPLPTISQTPGSSTPQLLSVRRMHLFLRLIGATRSVTADRMPVLQGPHLTPSVSRLSRRLPSADGSPVSSPGARHESLFHMAPYHRFARRYHGPELALAHRT